MPIVSARANSVAASLGANPVDIAPMNPAEKRVGAVIMVCLCLFVGCGWALTVDQRTLDGVNVWVKPMKFAASLAMHLATLLFFCRLLNENARHARTTRLALLLAAAASLFEVAYITLQAARGRASHFNSETLIEIVMYQLMGGAVLLLVGASAIIGLMVLRSARDGTGYGLRLGSGWGALLGSGATLIVAGTMASGLVSGPGPWIGAHDGSGLTVPIFGWSRQVGDLRVSHFFATHLIQMLPAVGILADRFLHRRNAGRIVTVSALLGLAVCAGTFIQALAGRPLFVD